MEGRMFSLSSMLIEYMLSAGSWFFLSSELRILQDSRELNDVVFCMQYRDAIVFYMNNNSWRDEQHGLPAEIF